MNNTLNIFFFHIYKDVVVVLIILKNNDEGVLTQA